MQAIINGYEFKFNMQSNLLLLIGDSGIGKTLIFNYFKDISVENKNIICFSLDTLYLVQKQNTDKTFQKILLEELKKINNSLIVIDNIDTLLDDDCRNYIYRDRDRNNKYLLLGRNGDGLGTTPNRIAELIRDDKSRKLIIKYKYLEKKY